MKMKKRISLIIFSSLLTISVYAEESTAQKSGETTLKEVTVEEKKKKENGYAEGESTGALKTKTSLLETPQSVQIINKEYIKDYAAVRTDDIVQNVSGVKPGGTYVGWDYYRIRGFDASFNYFLDGLAGSNDRGEEVFGLEKIEILKGPISTLYGQGPMSGMVHYVSKRPKAEDFLEARFTYGSFNLIEPSIDLGKVLNENKSVYFRLNAMYRHQDSFVDYAKNDRVYIAPSLTWEISKKTNLTILTRYVQDKGNLAMPLPAKGTVLPNINGDLSFSTFMGDPKNPNVYSYNYANIGYELKHQFNDSLSVRQNTRYGWIAADNDGIYYPSSLAGDEKTMSLYPFQYTQDAWYIRNDNAMDYNFNLGSVKNYFIFGVDFGYKDDYATSRQINYSDTAAYSSLDIYNTKNANWVLILQDPTIYADQFDRSWGIYAQEQAKLTDSLILTLGGRYSFIHSANKSFEAFSPKAGLNYTFGKDFSVYGSYSESFESQLSNVDINGNPLEPQQGQNIEAGIKTAFFNDKVLSTLAVFQLTKTNIAVADVSNTFYTVTGEQRSRGFEYDLTLNLLKEWSLIGSYTFIEAKVTKDDVIPVGDKTSNVPEHSASLWTKYTLSKGILKNLGFGIGGRYYTKQSGDLPNTFTLPAYGILDAAIYYKIADLNAQVNFYNLLNERYALGSYNNLYVLPGEPFSIRGTVSYSL